MYCELQCKTNFSFLRGASEAHELMARAVELGLSGIAITDVNGVYALPRAYEALKEMPNLKLICGSELTITDHPPLSLIALNRKGYGLLTRIITALHAGKEKGKGTLTIAELLSYVQDSAASGLVAYSDAVSYAQHGIFKEVFQDRYFLKLTRSLDGLDEERTQGALQLSKQFDLRVLATNDVHYHRPERRRLQDALTCVREGVTLRTGGFKLFGNEERYLKSPLQMRSLFRDCPDAIHAGLSVLEQCTFSLSELTHRYPSEWIPKGYTAHSYLEELVWKGAYKKFSGAIPIEIEKQAMHELSLIKKMSYADYFLTVYDIVDFAKRSNIYCQGRGSAANSVVCFCLGITVIDPVKMNLLFERFISENRNEPPDIDVDFEHERREEVIQYLYHKYGRHRAAMISAVRTYRSRSAFLEMSKAVGVNVGSVSAAELERDFEARSGTLGSKRHVIDELTAELKGFPRHLSIHACGFTLSADPIIETVPVEPARMEQRTICQWDKNDLDTLGLIKVDVLSLGFLSAIHKACDLTGIHFSEIPQTDDPNVYGMIQQGNTIGTFQIESRAQISTLGMTLPENFYDLVVEVALVRPGPNVGNMKNPYIERRDLARQGKHYRIDDPVIANILGRTYGVPIFQEQVMKLAIAKAGFTPGEADQLRRAIAAWRSADAVDALSVRFFEGLVAHGMSESMAKEMMGYMKGFSAYGFPESHAASFAMLSYLSAWLKYYHPAELLIGLLNSQPMGFYPIDVLINDAIRNGVSVLPLDPNISEWDAVRESQGCVRMGFRNIVGIRKEWVLRMVEERKSRAFTGIHDFISRTGFSRDVLETMAMADVFVSFGLDQRHSFWSSIEIRALLERSASEQMSLFCGEGEKSDALRRPPVFDSMSLYEEIVEDYRGTSYSLRGNIMRAIRSENPNLPMLRSTDVKKLRDKSVVTYAGIVLVLQRPPTANGVAFVTLEDDVGSVDVVIFKHVYERYVNIIRGTRCLIVKGRVVYRGKSMSLIASSIRSFESGPLVQRVDPK